MDYEAFVSDVMAQAHFGAAAQARRAVEAVLFELAAALPARVVLQVADVLPAEMARVMREATGEGARSQGDFYARIGERAGLSLSQGLEQAQIVCAVLAKRLGGDVTERLLRELPDALAPLFLESEQVLPTLPSRQRLQGHTLADGAPGSQHGLSTAIPGSGHSLSESRPRDAQAHSVADLEPHQDSKLSSARDWK